MSLQTLTLHNTSVTGPLPGVSRATYLSQGFNTSGLCAGGGAGLGRLPTLQFTTISDTLMSAECDARQSYCNDITEYLPW